MAPVPLLVAYCILIIGSSVAGGLIPHVVRLDHRRMQIALSFVSGVMLGVAVLHLLPHAIIEQSRVHGPDDGHAASLVAPVADADVHDHDHDHDHDAVIGHDLVEPVAMWLIAGLLTMFLLERCFCYHHHDAPDGCATPGAGGHGHRLTWGGATVGLVVHTLIAGVALGASVESEAGHGHGGLLGLSTFLVIFLHKPFDSLTIGTLMVAGGQPVRFRHVVNVLFSLAIPAGVILFYLGAAEAGVSSRGVVSAALAFSAGTFLCISLSDLLPELQFHRHDRVKLTLALAVGLAAAWLVGLLEG